MKFHLVDTDKDLVKAWRREFAEFPEVDVSEAEILAVARGCVVLPSDDWGILPEVISPQIVGYFGTHLQSNIRRAVLERAGANLLVGEAISLSTGDERIPRLIVTSTRGLSGHISSNNVYHALRAVFGIVKPNSMVCDSVFCPGLDVGRDRVPAQSIAAQMARAYAEWRAGVEPASNRRRSGVEAGKSPPGAVNARSL